jgi:hypothetical protein
VLTVLAAILWCLLHDLGSQMTTCTDTVIVFSFWNRLFGSRVQKEDTNLSKIILVESSHANLDTLVFIDTDLASYISDYCVHALRNKGRT